MSTHKGPAAHAVCSRPKRGPGVPSMLPMLSTLPIVWCMAERRIYSRSMQLIHRDQGHFHVLVLLSLWSGSEVVSNVIILTMENKPSIPCCPSFFTASFRVQGQVSPGLAETIISAAFQGPETLHQRVLEEAVTTAARWGLVAPHQHVVIVERVHEHFAVKV
eukprot:1151964-Pelagomonas_calceolata.AAC.10